ncbi:MAG: S-layer homology domain-containing protein [Syntrophomonadaceae bacterium]|nr:S-layer homology domain-containing protein [Syntrophomonadaceae bacterium]
MARALGHLPVYGRAQQAIYGFKDWNSFSKAKIPYCEAIIGAGIMTGRTVDRFYPRQAIKRGEMAAVLDKAALHYLPAQGFKNLEGTLASTGYLVGVTGSTVRNHYQVVQADGSSIYMLVDADRDFLVYKNKNLGRSSFLNTGDQVKIMAGPLNEILLVEATAGVQTILEGILDYVDIPRNNLHLTNWEGKNQVLAFSPIVRVNLSGYPANLNDLVPGQQVSLFLNGPQVSEIRSTVDFAATGALPRETNYAYGKLYLKNNNELSIRDDNGKPYTYSLTSSTRYYINGLSASYYDLKTGDYLKLTLDSDRSIIRVDVTQDYSGYKVYLARIYDVNNVYGQIRFDQIYRYYDESMTKEESGMISFNTANDFQAYSDNLNISIKELEKYRGDYAYFITARRGDQEQVVKLSLRDGTERRIIGQVNEINTSFNHLTVEFEPDRIYYDSGTLVIRYNRLIDGDSIKAGEDVVVFAERANDGSVRAKLIMVNSPGTESRYTLHKGYLSKVISRSLFEVGSSYILRTNDWQGSSGRSQFYYDYQTRFLLADNDTSERISDTQFYNLDEGDWIDRDVYVVADGDRALAVILRDDGMSFKSEMASRGTIISIDANELVLKDVRNWSRISDSWSTQSDTLPINTKYAVVARNGEGKDLAALRVGDPVYVLRFSLEGSEIYASLILVE